MTWLKGAGYEMQSCRCHCKLSNFKSFCSCIDCFAGKRIGFYMKQMETVKHNGINLETG